MHRDNLELTSSLLCGLNGHLFGRFVRGSLPALHELINDRKLSIPFDVVQKLAQIEAVVVRRISFRVVCWGDRAHFVTIDRVVEEETLDFGGHLPSRKMTPCYRQLAIPGTCKTKV